MVNTSILLLLLLFLICILSVLTFSKYLGTNHSYSRILLTIFFGILASSISWYLQSGYSFGSGDEAFIKFIYSIPKLLLTFTFSLILPILVLYAVSVLYIKLMYIATNKVFNTQPDNNYTWRFNIIICILLSLVFLVLFYALYSSGINTTILNITNSYGQKVFNFLIPYGFPLSSWIMCLSIILVENLKKRES